MAHILFSRRGPGCVPGVGTLLLLGTLYSQAECLNFHTTAEGEEKREREGREISFYSAGLDFSAAKDFFPPPSFN